MYQCDKRQLLRSHSQNIINHSTKDQQLLCMQRVLVRIIHLLSCTRLIFGVLPLRRHFDYTSLVITDCL